MSNASNNNEMKKDCSDVVVVDKSSSPISSSARKRHLRGSSNHHRGSRRKVQPENDNNRRCSIGQAKNNGRNSSNDSRTMVDDDERKPAAAAAASDDATSSTVAAWSHSCKQQQQQQQQVVNVNDNDNDDAYPPPTWLLQCQTIENGAKQQSLWWYSPALPTTLSQEQAVLPALLRWNQKERGMMKSQPVWRKQEIVNLCRQVRIPLDQALSLRRHHMKRLNPTKRMPALGLGSEDAIRESARLFEEAVADCLRRHGVAFYTEEDQKRHYAQHYKDNNNLPPLPATPDFLLKQQVVITKYYYHHRKGQEQNNNNSQQQQQQQRVIIDEPRKINWVEAKMFYGACSMEEDNISAVGRILPTARKYCKYFGPGAFCFMQGCGEGLVRDLASVGVMALDCSSSSSDNNNSNSKNSMVSLAAVQAHQQTWCADAHGNILP